MRASGIQHFFLVERQEIILGIDLLKLFGQITWCSDKGLAASALFASHKWC